MKSIKISLLHCDFNFSIIKPILPPFSLEYCKKLILIIKQKQYAEMSNCKVEQLLQIKCEKSWNDSILYISITKQHLEIYYDKFTLSNLSRCV